MDLREWHSGLPKEILFESLVGLMEFSLEFCISLKDRTNQIAGKDAE